jgi:putative hemolysin
VIEESERAIISGVVRLADRPVREVMTPRTQVEWIDLDDEDRAVRRICRTAACRSAMDRSIS